MNPNDLPIVGVISNPEKDFYGSYSDLTDKKLLLIGFSESEVDDYVAKYNPSEIKLLTNWVDHKDATSSKYPVFMGDVCGRTNFSENYFDAVLTLSVLEHLHDIYGACSEMMRVVKPGGAIVHMFGPAWSSAYGHHLYADIDVDLLNFCSWKMPAHMHLLCSREEILDFYIDQGLGREAGQKAIHWFYETKLINRLFFDQYLHVFANSNLQLDKMEIMYNKLPDEHLSRLRREYPGYRDFSAYGGKFGFVVNK